MPTHEPEVTETVDLCRPDGRTLDPAARGWSRRPLHRANLRGRWGRTKRWDYWAILADDVVVSVTYADVDYLGLADVWWLDQRTGVTGGHQGPVPLARGLHLPDRPGTEPLTYAGGRSSMSLIDDEGGTTITATWPEAGGTIGRLDARIDLPEDHESLNVVIPWSDRTFQFTSKHQARPARGSLTVGDRTYDFGVPPGGETGGGAAWGVLDVGRGRWPYRTRWNWGGGAGIATDGRTVVGVQFGAKWTEGTGFTENGVIVDGRLNKIGEELVWTYDWDAPMQPWRVHHPDGSLDLTLAVDHDKHSRTQALVLATEVHQVFGRWTGHVTDETGRRVEVDGILGFAEESRSRW
jgi:hypothetical protein